MAGQRGKLAVGEHKELKTADEVVRRAERLAEKAPNVGPMAYEIEANHEFEDYSEQRRWPALAARRTSRGAVGARG